jgi:dihydrolipoamide dehydrogenase
LGCIPTKALLRSAEVFELTCHANDYGVAADNVRFDAESIIKQSREVAGRLSRGVEGLLKNKAESDPGEKPC